MSSFQRVLIKPFRVECLCKFPHSPVSRMPRSNVPNESTARASRHNGRRPGRTLHPEIISSTSQASQSWSEDSIVVVIVIVAVVPILRLTLIRIHNELGTRSALCQVCNGDLLAASATESEGSDGSAGRWHELVVANRVV